MMAAAKNAKPITGSDGVAHEFIPEFIRDTLPLWIVFLGLALRLYAAVSHLDISHPDEHFQTLEPASHVVFGYGWLSWEWSEGTRSWLVPSLYVPLLWIFKLLGFNGGPAPIAGCRALMALVTSFGVYQFWILLRENGLRPWSSLIALTVFALSPAFAAWGAMTLSDVWAWVFLWSAFPFVLRALQTEKRVFLAGILLGLSFLIRIQMVLWPVGIGAVLLFRKPFPTKLMVKLVAGYCVIVLFQGVLDWVTWGAPFHSVILNIKKNLLENVAAFYGTSPFYEYFMSVPRSVGWPIVVCAFGIFIFAVSGIFGPRARLTEKDLFVLVPSFLYLIVHSAIGHKELRFMFPFFPAILYLLARGLSAFEERVKIGKIRSDLVGAITVVIAIVSSGYVYSDDHTYLFDLSELTLKVRQDGGLAHGGCLIILDHYWVWTRGMMMIGAPMKYIELSSSHPITEEAKQCPYAISLPGRDAWFLHTPGAQWERIATDNHGQFLMKRILTKS